MACKSDDISLMKGHAFSDHTFHHYSEMNIDRIYMDYNATTPLEPEVIQAISEALQDAWGNPSSNYIAGAKAKAIINQSRGNVARMVGGKAEDIIFTSGGTEANNLVLHTAVEHFRKSCRAAEQHEGHQNGCSGRPHIITSNVEHDSIKLVAEHLQMDGKADVTFVPVSKVTARVEVDDVIAAVRPNTCLISVMLANNETGVIMAAELVTSHLSEYESHMQSTKLYLEERLRAVFKDKIHFNSHYPGSDILPNTCNVSILGPTLQGWRVLSNCRKLLASVGAACHSDSGNRPSHILLSCGVPSEVAANALRLSVGRGTTEADVDAVVEDLRETVQLLEEMN